MKARLRIILIVALFVLFVVVGFLVTRRGSRALPDQDLVVLSPLAAPVASPPGGSVQMGNTNAAISLTFAIPVDPKTAVVESVPPLELLAAVRKDDLHTLLVSPKIAWAPNVSYKITLRAGLLSSDGAAALQTDVVLQYDIKAAPAPVFSGSKHPEEYVEEGVESP